jgi:hypothetical protein
MIHLEQGFVLYRDTFHGGPPAFFADIAQPIIIVKNSFYVLQTMLGDGVVVCGFITSRITR